jgi:hypothetical protein
MGAHTTDRRPPPPPPQIVTSGGGAFTFPYNFRQDQGFTLSIINNPLGQTCSVSPASGTLAESDVTNIVVSCKGSTIALGLSAAKRPAADSSTWSSNGGSSGSGGGGALSDLMVLGMVAGMVILYQRHQHKEHIRSLFTGGAGGYNPVGGEGSTQSQAAPPSPGFAGSAGGYQGEL